MQFQEIIGQSAIKKKLKEAIRENRISHAQLFLGPEGSGALALAIATAQYLSCENPGEDDSCGKCIHCKQYMKLIHPDLHFLYPHALTEKEIKSGMRNTHSIQFRESVSANPYLTLSQWYSEIDLEQRQGTIYVDDVAELAARLSLKSYSGAYKIAIVWIPELMVTMASNKMLKILEEPPDKTLFFLVAENSENMLATVLSRMQLIKVNKLDEQEMFDFLHKEKELEFHVAKNITALSDGSLVHANQLLHGEDNTQPIQQVREWFLLCFEFPNKSKALLTWIDKTAFIGREEQKVFLRNALQVIRESFLCAAGASEMVKLAGEEKDFVVKFSKFINPSNVSVITQLIDRASYHIERNAHAKLLFLNLSLKIGQLLKAKV